MVSFPWSVLPRREFFEEFSLICLFRSFSILGIVPGIIVTVAVAGTCLYTSLILGRFCIKHPEMRDIVDIGQYLFGGSKLVYNIVSIMFVLNNIFIQGATRSKPLRDWES
jgi:hypothetical protein